MPSDEIVEKGIFSVVVKDLSVNIVEADIRDKFEAYGTIEDVFLPLDGYTRKNRGFGFVRFSNKDDQEEAIRDVKKNGCRIGGRNVRAEFATSEPKLGGQHEARGGRGGEFVDRRVKSVNARDYHGDMFRRGRDDRNGYRPRDDDYQGAQRPRYEEEARGLYVRRDDKSPPRYEARERSPSRAGYADDPRDEPREPAPRREEYRPRDEPRRDDRARDDFPPRRDDYAPRRDDYAPRSDYDRVERRDPRHDDPRHEPRREEPRYEERRPEPRYDPRYEDRRDPYADRRHEEPRYRDAYDGRREERPRGDAHEPRDNGLRDAYDRDAVKLEPRRGDSRDRYEPRRDSYRDDRYR